MDADQENATRYRHRAKELRLFADDKHNTDVRVLLLKIADSYDELADSMVRIDDTDRLLSKT